MKAVQAPTLEDIRAARERIAGSAIRTPLIQLNLEDAPAEIYLKLENLQPIGSFKIRGAGNAMRLIGKEKLSNGVYTASAAPSISVYRDFLIIFSLPCRALTRWTGFIRSIKGI